MIGGAKNVVPYSSYVQFFDATIVFFFHILRTFSGPICFLSHLLAAYFSSYTYKYTLLFLPDRPPPESIEHNSSTSKVYE